jgi:hypothetical protein
MASCVTFEDGDEAWREGAVTYAHTDGKPDIRDLD